MKMTIVTHSTVINLKAQAVAVFAADCKHVIHILRGKGPEGCRWRKGPHTELYRTVKPIKPENLTHEELIINHNMYFSILYLKYMKIDISHADW